MRINFRKMIAAVLCLALCIPTITIKADTDNTVQESSEQFYLSEKPMRKAARSLSNAPQLPVSHERFDKFQCTDGTPNTAECPNLGVGIKYIEGDNGNPDGGGKRRYVYCLDFQKTSPGNGVNMQHVGWSNKKVSYALYYGAVYYGYPCRYEPYATGDWKMDYFVTQMAIHVLNGEYTLAALQKGLNKSSASEEEKNLVYSRINKLVRDAEQAEHYGGFTQEGWIDMNEASFTLEGYEDTWRYEAGSYLSGGVFHPVFKSYNGYDYREQLTGYEVQVPEGVTVRKKGEQLYADFDLAIKEAQYKKWQLTGKTIPVNVTASIPRYWGGGIYQCAENAEIQEVCFLTWTSSGGNAVFEQTANLHIPKITGELTIDKKDADTGKLLSGASFSLWAYDGEKYSKKAGTFQEEREGRYVCRGIDYTLAANGRFLIREDSAPSGYDKNYQKESSADEEAYQLYGGREIQMDENGFRSDQAEEPFVFRDKKLIPQAELVVKKYDADTGKNLEGAEFSVYAWNSANGRYSEEPVQVLQYDRALQQYRTSQNLMKNQENDGKFLVKETRMPQGYHCPWSQEVVLTEPGTVTLELEAPNYPGRKFVIHKKILKEEIVWEHGNPTFFFKVSGTDQEGKKHTYHSFIEFTPEQMKEQDGEYLTGTTTISNIPAGVYQAVEKDDILRYILTDVSSDQEHVKIEKKTVGTINGTEKIQAVVTADLNQKDGSVTFENRKICYQDFSDNAVVVNHFKVKEE